MSFAACLLTGEYPRRAGGHVRDDLEHVAYVDAGLIRGRPRFTVAFVLVMSRGTLTKGSQRCPLSGLGSGGVGTNV